MQLLFYFIVSKLLPIGAGFYYYRKLSLPYRLALFLTVIALACEVLGFYIYSVHKTNAWLFNLYMPIEVWSLGIAAICLVQNAKVKIAFWLLLFLNTVIWIVDLANHSLYVFANFAMVTGSILLTMMYITVLFSNSLFNSRKILGQPIFWLCISTILYFSCDVPFMGLHNYLSTNLPKMAIELEYINTILDIIRYPLVAISFILLGREGTTLKPA